MSSACSRTWLAVALTLAVVSCREPVTAGLGQPFDLRVGQTARISNDLDLRFVRVASDSRCPRGVVCVWAGEATVTLEGRIQKGTPETFDVRLPGGAAAQDTVPTRAYDGYRIRVLALEPAPTAGTPADTTAYVATLLVEIR